GLKRIAYLRGWKRSTQIPVPVVVIGNLYVGGTGKTPLLQETVKQLQERGWHPGIISRGYGAAPSKRPRVGHGKLDPSRFGDEPALLARTTLAPVAVHPERAAAAHALLLAYPETDVVLMDDGLQHLALQRDIEIVVQDER